MQPKLTIQERLKDLRVERGLTLEQLSAETGISKSALGKYEADDFKDISPFAQAAEAGEAALKGGSLTEFEKRCDDAVADYLSGAQMIPFGEAPMLAYLAARETEYTNIRILLMGRAAGLSPEIIRSRLRRINA